MLDPRRSASWRVHVALPPASELALLVAQLDGVAARLLAAHVADRDGRHCAGCALPQAGVTPWPCTLHEIAVQAQAIEHARRIPRLRRTPT